MTDTGLSESAGLSSEQAARLLKEYGPNILEEKKPSLFRTLIRLITSPMSIMFIIAGVLSWWSQHVSDAIIIAALFGINTGVSIWHEAKADTALKKLKEKLVITVTVTRDGTPMTLLSSQLVPGDHISLSNGSLIPADVTFLVTHNVSVNESAVTGESLPLQKNTGDKGYSGTFLTTGIAEALVTATGNRTYFGQTLALIDTSHRQSRLEKDILSVSKFLSIISIIVMVVLTIVLTFAHQPFSEIATLDVSMLIAGIPVALSTVMTLIISIGVLDLAHDDVIVRRLSSLEDLANVNLLLSDKTGTLTENRITVAEMVRFDHEVDDKTMWQLALSATSGNNSPLDTALQAKGKELGYSALPIQSFTPGDSERKRSTALLHFNGNLRAVALGAPQTILSMSNLSGGSVTAYHQRIADMATEGFRVLVLAISPDKKEEHMQPLAFFTLADTVRKDAQATIAFMREYGISTKIVTGDNYDIAHHVAHILGISGTIVNQEDWRAQTDSIKNHFSDVAGFSGVLPKDKYDIVALARSLDASYVVAVTGDGVNDVPAVKAADVGIAVANAVDALKGTADIVLMQPGISVIKDAIIGARKIFSRLYNYSVYRISESFRLIITIGLIGILYHTYPLTPVQIILIALLNDVPIITMAFDRVAISRSPATINTTKRFKLSSLFGLVGILNSMVLLWGAVALFHLPWPIIQTLFFLKLTVSGHMLIYVAHTEKRWYSFLPAKQVIWATVGTQLLASIIAYAGIFTAPIPLLYIIIVWVWSLIWMQISELPKMIILGKKPSAA